jgi:hypothetical protein
MLGHFASPCFGYVDLWWSLQPSWGGLTIALSVSELLVLGYLILGGCVVGTPTLPCRHRILDGLKCRCCVACRLCWRVVEDLVLPVTIGIHILWVYSCGLRNWLFHSSVLTDPHFRLGNVWRG